MTLGAALAFAVFGDDDLRVRLRTRRIRGMAAGAEVDRVDLRRMSGIGIAVHVCEHYSYHTGQIAFWTKILRSKDLGFYAGVDLNVKNAG